MPAKKQKKRHRLTTGCGGYSIGFQEKKNSKEDIEKHFTDKINDLYGMKDGKPEYQLHYKWMDEVPPDVNGKMRCFICNVKDEETK